MNKKYIKLSLDQIRELVNGHSVFLKEGGIYIEYKVFTGTNYNQFHINKIDKDGNHIGNGCMLPDESLDVYEMRVGN